MSYIAFLDSYVSHVCIICMYHMYVSCVCIMCIMCMYACMYVFNFDFDIFEVRNVNNFDFDIFGRKFERKNISFLLSVTLWGEFLKKHKVRRTPLGSGRAEA